MLEIMDDKETFLSNFSEFEKQLGAGDSPKLHRLRQAAIERFAELGFPTVRDEEWRFTNLAPLSKQPYSLPKHGVSEVTLAALAQVIPGFDAGPRLVFVNGFYESALSSVAGLPHGVTVASLANVLQAHPEQVEPHLARYADYEDSTFVALNTGFLRDGAFVSIAKGTVLQAPIQLVFVSTAPAQATVSHPRNLIVAGINSQATIIESYVGLGEEVYFTNPVTEIVLAEGAHVDHYKLQRESKAAFHIAAQQVQSGRGSNFSSHSISFGAALARNDVNAYLADEGCECTLNGLYLADGTQLIDNHTRIDHARPNCASHELYKGILDGKAHGVFNGRIHVHQDAQKTDAKQTNKTLLLSDEAVIDAKPQLEIYADDVKCTHGATIGQLAAEAIFYLQTRGISKEQARGLLTFAFANDIIGRIKVEPLREQLERTLLDRQSLPAGRDVQE
jgi:Fe-S cluster assembly protein SufD